MPKRRKDLYGKLARPNTDVIVKFEGYPKLNISTFTVLAKIERWGLVYTTCVAAAWPTGRENR